MSAKVRWRQSDVTRAIKSVRDSGEPVAGVDIRPDGTIRVLTTLPAPSNPEPSPLEAWERERGLDAA